MSRCERAPTISIVTPSFNTAEYLEETLESVLSQGYEGLEYVVVDGASKDGSVEIIERHAAGIEKWVSEPDKGHADAVNKGFALTSGEIMAFLNSSDAYYPWTLRTVAEIFCDLPQVEWIMGIPSYLQSGRRPLHVAPSHVSRFDLLGATLGVQQESVFWRRSLWDKAGGRLDDTLRLACDYELWVRFSRHARLYHVQTVLAGFRYHDERRGNVASAEYEDEARRVREAELAILPAGERRCAALVRALCRAGGPPATRLAAHSRLLPGYRHPRVRYDFEGSRWVTG